MTAVNGNGGSEIAVLAHVAAAERFATALVFAFESCEEAGSGLSEVQKVALLEAALIEFDGFADHLRSLEDVGKLLRQLRHT